MIGLSKSRIKRKIDIGELSQKGSRTVEAKDTEEIKQDLDQAESLQKGRKRKSKP